MNPIWGTVKSVTPFTVRLDGTSTDIPALNASVCTTATIGQRCLCINTKGIVMTLVVMNWTGSAWNVVRN